MNEESRTAIDMNALKYFLMGVALILILALVMFNPIKIVRYDREPVEVQVVKKEIIEQDGEKLYLLHCVKADGEQETLELHKESIGERFEQDVVYKQIKTGKYYNFRVAMKEEFKSHYRTVCGAVKLINGFSEETTVSGK